MLAMDILLNVFGKKCVNLTFGGLLEKDLGRSSHFIFSSVRLSRVTIRRLVDGWLSIYLTEMEIII